MSQLLRVWGEDDITDTSKGLAQPFAAGTAAYPCTGDEVFLAAAPCFQAFQGSIKAG